MDVAGKFIEDFPARQVKLPTRYIDSSDLGSIMISFGSFME